MEYAIYIYIHGLYTILVIESDRILFFLCLWETWFGGEKNPLSLAWCWICLLWASLGFLFGGISKLVF
jgi:hypothetical protein